MISYEVKRFLYMDHHSRITIFQFWSCVFLVIELFYSLSLLKPLQELYVENKHIFNTVHRQLHWRVCPWCHVEHPLVAIHLNPLHKTASTCQTYCLALTLATHCKYLIVYFLRRSIVLCYYLKWWLFVFKFCETFFVAQACRCDFLVWLCWIDVIMGLWTFAKLAVVDCLKCIRLKLYSPMVYLWLDFVTIW